MNTFYVYIAFLLVQCGPQISSLLFVYQLTDTWLHLTVVDWPLLFRAAVQSHFRRVVICDGQTEAIWRALIQPEPPIGRRCVKVWIKARQKPLKTSFYTKTHSQIYTNSLVQANSRGQRSEETKEPDKAVHNNTHTESDRTVKSEWSDICLIST